MSLDTDYMVCWRIRLPRAFGTSVILGFCRTPSQVMEKLVLRKRGPGNCLQPITADLAKLIPWNWFKK